MGWTRYRSPFMWALALNMNIPNIPTDNLYKFISIFGLIIFLLSLIGPRLLIHSHRLQEFEMNESILILEERLKQISKEVNSLDGVDSKKVELSEIIELRKRNNELGVINIKNSIAHKKLAYFAQQIRNLVYMSYFGLIVGFFMSGFGFYFWYVKLQKPSELNES